MSKILGIYLFLLAALIGIELALGVFVAPTIFFPQSFLGDGVLSHFQSGQLMTQIFLKYNKILMIITAISFIFEMVNFNNNKSQNFNFRFSTLMLAVLNLILMVLFVLVFTDYIVEAQKAGAAATQTAEFAKIHKGSEWTMKFMIIAQTILFFMKFPRSNSANFSQNSEQK
ncbi:MAG: DUF4149 domain-containing protein [Campylobacter sp.]|nr:DUF4149 domain-containing protein [Campylobacter sp.]